MRRSPIGTPLRERLLHRRVITPDGCWEWDGARHPHGYGLIGIDGRMTRVHRVAHELFIGPIPEGLHVCHRCDNPPCFNPDHLFAGTRADNMRDMAAKGRQVFQKHPERAVRGARNGRHRLTPDEVREMRALGGSMTNTALAKRFGVGRTQVRRILQKEQWIDV